METHSSILSSLSNFASELDYPDLPSKVIEKAKVCLIDCLSIAASARESDASHVAHRTVSSIGSLGDATVWFTDQKSRAIDSVVANCVTAHSILQDDWDPWSHAHIGVSVVPTALALAEEHNRSGREVLLAIVAGYEIESRAGVLSVPTFTRGFRASSVYSYFGSAAAAAKVIGLPQHQYMSALACAGGVAGGVLQPWVDGSMEWTFQAAFGCRAGILATILAANGFRASPHILDGTHGVNMAFAGTRENQHVSISALGERFQMLDTCHKRVPSGGANQGSMGIMLALMSQHEIDYRRVRTVRIRVPHTGTHERMNYPGITYQGPFHSIDQCLISKPFGVAAILKHGALNMDIVMHERDNPELTQLAHKVELEEIENISGWTLSIEIELDDGEVIRGDQTDIDQSHIYLDWVRASAKFIEHASNTFDDVAVHRIIELVSHLEELDSIDPIVNELGKPPKVM
jgi:2-methylcitrate dehydratase PrpD